MIGEIFDDVANRLVAIEMSLLVVCAFEVLEHIVDDADTLAGWVEHVRPGGYVLVSVPADPHRFGPWGELDADDLVVGVRRRLDDALDAAGDEDQRFAVHLANLRRGRDDDADEREARQPGSQMVNACELRIVLGRGLDAGAVAMGLDGAVPAS